LYASAVGFPVDASKAAQQKWCPIEAAAATCRFDPVPMGHYAVACFHDENGNKVLDTKLFGMPAEGTVVSNNAKGFMGPPSFEKAKFPLSASTEIELRMNY
jgi:uncharacterized protein (DUF2141 family)